ncbi:DUF927 domain-containing protein [Dyella sp. C9]|uniref:DUF927 domain-containing protein n=1 Tax=Dyella sp. C9 TaxID=2202154 RepID=UPI001E4D5B15|nr:DUF927 domain-containing protein [Dyella sp. C9]
MIEANHPLPSTIRNLENRAAFELAWLMDQGRVSSHGKRGEPGDPSSHQAFSASQRLPRGRVEVGKHGSTGRYELVTSGTDRDPGVYWIGIDDDGVDKQPEWICEPLLVQANTRNNVGSDWGRLLVFSDRDGREHRWAMPMSMLASDGAELRSELLRLGLTIDPDTRRRQHLNRYIQKIEAAETALCVARTGWHGNAFVLPDKTYNAGPEPVIYQATSLEGIALASAGTLDDWRSHVAKPCAGNSRLVLAISAGFAGPCLGLLGVEGGGLHLRGGSSVGKTTALQVAASLFGKPEFVRTWRQTDNALEGVAPLHSDLLLILDEIGQLDPRKAGEVAYMLGNGQGKGRANRRGDARAAARWRLLFLSSGEVSLSDLIAQAGGTVRAGQEVRVIDIPADAGKGLGLLERVPGGTAPGVFADKLKMAAATHYGHALPAFLEKLPQDTHAAREQLLSIRDDIAHQLVGDIADGQVRRVAQRFGLIAAAGTLATQFGLTGWAREEAEKATRICFDAWLAARGTKGNAEPIAMLRQVKAFLDTHGESRFTPWYVDEKTPRTINKAGFRRDADEGPEYFVEVEAFRREVTKGFDYKAVASTLAEHGALRLGGDGRLERKVLLPDRRNTRVYQINSKLWALDL